MGCQASFRLVRVKRHPYAILADQAGRSTAAKADSFGILFLVTLAVARCFPTADLVNFEKSVGRTMFERAVILASDSLYKRDGQRMTGLGEKVFLLARNCAAVISGRVDPARGALHETKRRMEELQGTSNWERFTAIVHDCFDKVTDTSVSASCLIGICSLSGEPSILKVSSRSSTRVELVTRSYEAIGADPDTRQAFCGFMEDKTRLGSRGASSPLSQLLRVVEALQSTIETHPKYIGEPVQALMITREGLRIPSVFDIAPTDDITMTLITPPHHWAPGPP